MTINKDHELAPQHKYTFLVAGMRIPSAAIRVWRHDRLKHFQTRRLRRRHEIVIYSAVSDEPPILPPDDRAGPRGGEQARQRGIHGLYQTRKGRNGRRQVPILKPAEITRSYVRAFRELSRRQSSLLPELTQPCTDSWNGVVVLLTQRSPHPHLMCFRHHEVGIPGRRPAPQRTALWT